MTKKTKIIILSLTALIAVMVFSFWSKPVLALDAEKITGAVASTLANSIFLIVSWILYVPAYVAGKISLVIIGLLIQVAKFNDIINVDAVSKAWLAMRDVCNMFFVVILLIMSFSTVLGIEKWNYKKLLSQLIIAAIMVNFSKMICGLLIDAGQVVMITFVNAFADSAPGVLANATGLSTLFSLTQDAGNEISNLALGGTILLNMLFVLISFVVILAIFLVLVIRVGMLWFLVALSPIAWVGSLLPATSSYASEWWTNFTKWIMIGPILAFFLWFSLLIFQTGGISKSFPNVPATNEKGSVTATLSQLSESPNTLNYAFSIVLLLMSLTFAQKLGGKAAGVAVGWAKKAEMGKFLLGATGVTGSFKAEKKAIQEKISETPYARVLTAEGRAARQQEREDKYRLRFGVPGAYEKSVQRKTKEYEEAGKFRNIDEMKKEFEQAKQNKDWEKMEIYGKQLAKKGKLEASDLKRRDTNGNLIDITTGLGGKAYQRAATVLDKLSDDGSDYNKSMTSSVKFENGKYRDKTTSEKIADNQKIRDKAKSVKVAGMGETLAHMNDITDTMTTADFQEQAHFYIGLGDDQLGNKILEKATSDKVNKHLINIINNVNYPTQLRQDAWNKLNNLHAKHPTRFSTPPSPPPSGGGGGSTPPGGGPTPPSGGGGGPTPPGGGPTPPPARILTDIDRKYIKQLREDIKYWEEKIQIMEDNGDIAGGRIWRKVLKEKKKKLLDIIKSKMA